jgi:hypothetical protein
MVSFAQHSRSAAPAGASARQTSCGPSRMRARVPRSSGARCTAAPGYTHTTRSVAFGTLSPAVCTSTRTNPVGPTTTRSRCAPVPPDLRGTHAQTHACAETHTCRHTRAQTLSPEYPCTLLAGSTDAMAFSLRGLVVVCTSMRESKGVGCSARTRPFAQPPRGPARAHILQPLPTSHTRCAHSRPTGLRARWQVRRHRHRLSNLQGVPAAYQLCSCAASRRVLVRACSAHARHASTHAPV